MFHLAAGFHKDLWAVFFTMGRPALNRNRGVGRPRPGSTGMRPFCHTSPKWSCYHRYARRIMEGLDGGFGGSEGNRQLAAPEKGSNHRLVWNPDQGHVSVTAHRLHGGMASLVLSSLRTTHGDGDAARRARTAGCYILALPVKDGRGRI